MIPLNVKSPRVHEMSEIPMIKDAPAINKLIGLAKSTLPSIQILAPSTPIIPKRATETPPSAPTGTLLRTAPNLGDKDKAIAPTPAIQ